VQRFFDRFVTTEYTTIDLPSGPALSRYRLGAGKVLRFRQVARRELRRRS
jgi:hypothetical protein